METFKVHLEQVHCADVEIEATDYEAARAKAHELRDWEAQWCEGHEIDVIDINRVFPDDDE